MIASTVDTALLYLRSRTTSNTSVAIDDSSGGDGIVANKDIKTIADLKGKTVAVNEGSGRAILSQRVARQGRNPGVRHRHRQHDDQRCRYRPSSLGQVDAAVTWEPALSKGKSVPHGHLLVDSSATRASSPT